MQLLRIKSLSLSTVFLIKDIVEINSLKGNENREEKPEDCQPYSRRTSKIHLFLGGKAVERL